MTKPVICMAALLALAGCAGSAPTPEQQAREEAKQESIADILSQPLPAEEYGVSERCLSTHQYHNVDILDDQHVVFRGRGGKLWLNELRSRCVGLRKNHMLQFRLRDSRICDMDTFESVDSFLWGMRSGTCSLGAFQPITAEQLEAIEAAVEEARAR